MKSIWNILKLCPVLLSLWLMAVPPLPAQQIITNVRTIAGAALGCSSHPLFYGFSGSGIVSSACFTQLPGAGTSLSNCINNSGVMTTDASGASPVCGVRVTGITFSATSQYLKVAGIRGISSLSNSYFELCIDVDSTITNYICYLPYGNPGTLVQGISSVNTVIGGYCPPPGGSDTDTYEISISGTAVAVEDVTTSNTFCTGTTISTPVAGSPFLEVANVYGAGSNPATTYGPVTAD